MKVLRDKIAVKAKPTGGEMRSAGGLFVPATADNEQITSGEVVCIGDDLAGYGDTPAEVSVGQTVWFNRFTAPKVKTPEGEFYVIKADDVLAVV